MEQSNNNMNPSSKNEDNKPNNKTFMILSAVLFAISCILGYLLYSQKNMTQTVIVEKEKAASSYEQTKGELDELMSKYETMETNDKQLQSQLDTEREKIAELQVQLEKYKGNESMVKKLKNELGTIRKLIKSYLRQIDSLNQVNTALNEENTKVKGDLETERTVTSKLNEDKKMLSEKVEMGAKLKAYSLFADGIDEKGSKDVTTSRARKTDKIRCVFVLGENSIAKSGKRSVYMVVTGPDNKVYAVGQDDSNVITINGSKIVYSSRKEINYDNNSQEVSMYFNKKDDFLSGKYKVDLYCDDSMLGTTSFELK
jgi:hypothetical protein